MNVRELSLKNISRVEQIAQGSIIRRFFSNPFKYLFAVGFKNIVYPFYKKGILINGMTFFNKPMCLTLPAGTDIYLTGGKSHNSEIRLAKFIIKNLEANECFVDVGAHYGYFSLLASEIVGPNGLVISFEASQSTFAVLQQNTQKNENIQIYNKAISDKNELISFFEFPVLYSEYNSIDVDQFKSEKWFSKFGPKKIQVETIVLDEYLNSFSSHPKIIKIDVEGAELKVISGLKSFLSTNECIIIMEYLNNERSNSEHQKATTLLEELGYKSFLILNNGELSYVDDINTYLKTNKLESDNILFKK